MKYIARQINPTYQESPMFVCGVDDYEGIFVIPTDRCTGINEEDYNDFINRINDYVSDFENGFEYSGYYANLTELLKFEIYDGEKPNTHIVHKWKEVFENWDSDDIEIVCNALSLYYNAEYDYTSIHGCCQGDYAEVIYDTAKWSAEAIEAFEIEYFNLGTEWMIDYEPIEDEIINDDDFDVNNYGDCAVYVYDWSDDGQRKELADAIGCKAENVIMFEYAGSYSMPVYNKIDF